jgi:hypothetical protein
MQLPQGELFEELRDLPACHSRDGRRDEFGANVTLGEGFLVDRIVICHGGCVS